MQPEYAEAVFPRTHTVCGLRLGAYTLGHALLLQRLHSPLPPLPATEKRPPGPADVALGVWVCRRPARSAHAALGRRRSRWWVQTLTWYFCGQAFTAAISEWDRYAIASADAPRMAQMVSDRVKRLGAPITVALHSRLMTEFGLTPEAALNVPLAQALWWTSVANEIAGVARWSEDGDDAYEEAKRLAKAAAENPPAPAVA